MATTEKKLEYLKGSIPFHIGDLSLSRQIELNGYAGTYSEEWLYIALAENPLDAWENWGFRLFEKPEFIKRINSRVKAFDEITDAQIDKEYKRRRKVKAENGIHLNEEKVKQKFKKIKEVGFYMSSKEAMAANKSHYYCPIESMSLEKKQDISLLISSIKNVEDLKEDDLWLIGAGVVETTVVKATASPAPKVKRKAEFVMD